MFETEQRPKPGNECDPSLFVTCETLKTFVELMANTIANDSQKLDENLSKCEYLNRIDHIRESFSRDLKQAAKIIAPLNPEFATELMGFLQPLEVANGAVDKVINRPTTITSVYKEETEKRKEKENLPPTPPIREKENKKEKEENAPPPPVVTSGFRPHSRRSVFRTPSRCTAKWQPTLEEVTSWAKIHLFKGSDHENGWIQWWYDQMDDVLEWRNSKDNQFINWKATIRAWWYRELKERQAKERDSERQKLFKLRVETAELCKEKAKQKHDYQKHADNYLPHDPSQKRGFFDR